MMIGLLHNPKRPTTVRVRGALVFVNVAPPPISRPLDERMLWVEEHPHLAVSLAWARRLARDLDRLKQVPTAKLKIARRAARTASCGCVCCSDIVSAIYRDPLECAGAGLAAAQQIGWVGRRKPRHLAQSRGVRR